MAEVLRFSAEALHSSQAILRPEYTKLGWASARRAFLLPGGNTTDLLIIKAKSGQLRTIEPDQCAHVDCIHPRLKGREYCFDHELEAERHADEEDAREDITDWTTLYFIGVRGGNAVKIGKSVNPLRRLADLQVSHYEELELIATIEMPSRAERWAHKALSEYRIRGEWFRRTDKVNEVIEAAKTGDWGRFFQSFA